MMKFIILFVFFIFIFSNSHYSQSIEVTGRAYLHVTAKPGLKNVWVKSCPENSFFNSVPSVDSGYFYLKIRNQFVGDNIFIAVNHPKYECLIDSPMRVTIPNSKGIMEIVMCERGLKGRERMAFKKQVVKKSDLSFEKKSDMYKISYANTLNNAKERNSIAESKYTLSIEYRNTYGNADKVSNYFAIKKLSSNQLDVQTALEFVQTGNFSEALSVIKPFQVLNQYSFLTKSRAVVTDSVAVQKSQMLDKLSISIELFKIMHEPDSARFYFSNIIKTDSLNLEYLERYAQDLYASGDYENALGFYKKALLVSEKRDDGSNVFDQTLFLYNISKCCYELNNLDEAINYCRMALAKIEGLQNSYEKYFELAFFEYLLYQYMEVQDNKLGSFQNSKESKRHLNNSIKYKIKYVNSCSGCYVSNKKVFDVAEKISSGERWLNTGLILIRDPNKDFLEARNLLNDSADKFEIVKLYEKISRTYNANAKFELSNIYADSSISIYEFLIQEGKTDYFSNVARLYQLKANNFRYMDSVGAMVNSLYKSNQALLFDFNPLVNAPMLSKNYIELGDLYSRRGDRGQAYMWLNVAYDLVFDTINKRSDFKRNLRYLALELNSNYIDYFLGTGQLDSVAEIFNFYGNEYFDQFYTNNEYYAFQRDYYLSHLKYTYLWCKFQHSKMQNVSEKKVIAISSKYVRYRIKTEQIFLKKMRFCLPDYKNVFDDYQKKFSLLLSQIKS